MDATTKTNRKLKDNKMETYFTHKFHIWNSRLCIEDNGDHILFHAHYTKTDENDTLSFGVHKKHRIDTPIRMAVLRRMAEDDNLHPYSPSREIDLTWGDVVYLEESEEWGICKEYANRTSNFE